MAKFVVPAKMCWSADSAMAPPQQLFLGPAGGFVNDGDDFFDPDEVVEMLEEVVEEVVEVEVEVEEVVEVLEKPKKVKKRKWGDKK
jgi:hypothetical protein